MLAALPAAAQQAAPPPQQQPGGAPLEVSVTGGISAPMPIAIPPMPTPQVTGPPAGNTDVLGQKLADVTAADLRNSGRSEGRLVGKECVSTCRSRWAP